MNAATFRVKDNAIAPPLYRAMELSNKSWKLILGPAVHGWEFSGSTRKVFLPDLTWDTAPFQDILEMVYQRKVWGTVDRLHAIFF